VAPLRAFTDFFSEPTNVKLPHPRIGWQFLGIALTHQVQLSRSEVRPGVYKIAPAAGLSKGEYGLYVRRGQETAPYMYDFSVE
jgi:hypothetical protein